ncbi:MAG: hypothetical protein J5613_04090 [Alphaproteobacteria bacterium]|nr:hypothetical protein [Alphaproteobacteria bacterium]
MSEFLKDLKLPDIAGRGADIPKIFNASRRNLYQRNPKLLLMELFDYLGVPDDQKELLFRLLTMEDYKQNIMSALDIPDDMDQEEVFQALVDMDKEIVNFNVFDEKTNQYVETPSIKLLFKEGTDSAIIDIITNAIYARSGIKQNEVLKIAIVNYDGEPIERDMECAFWNFPSLCQDVRLNHPDAYIVIREDFSAEKLKKIKLDPSYLSHIVVFGDYVCNKDIKVFPYQVNGTFDCHELKKDYLTKDTVLPLARTINCAFSVTDFDVLMDIIPNGVETLIVEPKLLNKKFMHDAQHLRNTLDFIVEHPDLTVLDTKGNNLLDVITEFVQSTDNAVKEQQKTSKEKPAPVKEVIENKISGEHLDVKDIIRVFRYVEKYKSLFESFNDDALERLIKSVLSDLRHNGIQKKLMRRADGVNVVCIDAAQLDLVYQECLNVIKEREAAKTEEQTVAPEKSAPAAVEKRKLIKVKEPIKIKKYISKAVLKNVTKSSQQNVKSVLRAINEINIDPLEMQFQGPVHIIKHGKIAVSGTVKKESGCCLVQSIDSSSFNDSKRIVWAVADGPDGLVIVSVGFVDTHNTKRTSNEYAELRELALKKRTYTAEELAEYIDVEEMVKGKKTKKFDLLPMMQKMVEFLENSY